jgi:hypothetical protein
MKTLIVDVLATVRLTRLILDDEITAPARDAAVQALISVGEARPELKPVTDRLEYLLGCPWCASVYCGALVFALRRVSPAAADVVSGALAASAVTGAVYSRLTE